MPLFRFGLNLQRQLGIDISTIITGGVGELGVTALGTTNIMGRRQRQMGATFALAGFTVFLYWLHD